MKKQDYNKKNKKNKMKLFKQKFKIKNKFQN